MIEVCGVTKSYYGAPVLQDVSFTAEDGQALGLIGYNGAGKTTLLHIIAGIYKPDAGCVRMDGAPVYDNPAAKAGIFMLTEDSYFLPHASLSDMGNYYRGYYQSWNEGIFTRLCAAFGLDPAAKIAGFSRGMKRQAGITLAFAAAPRCLLLDEVFDGLDLAMRRATRKLLADYIAASGATVVITSHNLLEMEDHIDKIAMIHGNTLRYTGGVEALKSARGSLEEYFLEEGNVSQEAFIGVFAEAFPTQPNDATHSSSWGSPNRKGGNP